MTRIIIFSIIYILSFNVFAEKIVTMKGSTVVGNQELPKVLYVIPWKNSILPDLSEPPLESLIDEALAPVDREVFRREINYYEAIQQSNIVTK
jgi:hypothetical protein